MQHTSSGPQLLPAWKPNAGGIRAFYFRDPDGHALEVLWFPQRKGAAKWRAPTDRLFLGIDHTAIVISDTEASLRFYRDQLGTVIARCVRCRVGFTVRSETAEAVRPRMLMHLESAHGWR